MDALDVAEILVKYEPVARRQALLRREIRMPETYEFEFVEKSSNHHFDEDTTRLYAQTCAQGIILRLKALMTIGQYEFLTLNDIRSMFGAKKVQAEYEMCYGVDKFEAIDYRYRVADNLDHVVTIRVPGVHDLRHRTQTLKFNDDIREAKGSV